MNRAFLCVAVLLVAIGHAHAADKTVYVIDQITITLRSGQGTQHPILRTLPSGTPLQILSMNEETGYTHVRTKDGVEGWVLSQYLIDEPTSKIKLTAAEQKLARVDAEKKDLETTIETLRKERDTWEQERTSLTEERDRLLQATPAPADPSAVVQTAQPAPLPPEKEAEMLRQENQILQERSRKDTLVIGAIIFMAGSIFGIVLSRIRVRRSGWGGNSL